MSRDSDKRPFYLTTAIYYANAAPHIGHAYEIIAADVIARFHRLIGETVFFLTGTDEHGIKVQKTAAKHEMSPKAYTDQVAESFKRCWSELGVDSSRFIRTTDTDHYETVAYLWRLLRDKGDIFKKTYTGLYCSGCELFMTERDLTDNGLCPHHMVPPEPVAEENYFFRLSHYKDAILAHLEANPEFIQPEFRRNEVLNMLQDLDDISVSRSINSVTWGIPVPDDPEQVIYVWIDALSNYLTGIGWPNHNAEQYNTFWPPNVQVIGKDILRFHSIYWPAMLFAAGIPLPKTLLVHGFITVGDTKISKSIGNVIAPADLVERFELPNVDPIRYYMMASTHFGQDGSYTDEDFKLRINADLANNLGNLLNRTLNMTVKYADGKVPQANNDRVILVETDELNMIRDKYTAYQFSEAINGIRGIVDKANKLINDAEPWTLAKAGDTQGVANVLYSVLESLRQVAILLFPVTPALCQQLWEQLGYNTRLETADWRWLLGNPLPAGQQTQLGQPLLLRLDSDIVGAGAKKG